MGLVGSCQAALHFLGGAWNSARTDCRTEYRGEGRDAAAGYEDVGFRVIQVAGAEEPAQKAEPAPRTASAGK